MEETSRRHQPWGKGHQQGITGGYQESKQQMPVQAKEPFIRLPSVLLLMTTSWLFFLTSFSGEHLQIASVNAALEWTGSFSLPLVIGFALLCVVSDCWPSALVFRVHPVPSSFFLSAGQPKAHCTGPYWHHSECMSPSPLTSAKALWNSCWLSSRIYQ